MEMITEIASEVNESYKDFPHLAMSPDQVRIAIRIFVRNVVSDTIAHDLDFAAKMMSYNRKIEIVNDNDLMEFLLKTNQTETV